MSVRALSRACLAGLLLLPGGADSGRQGIAHLRSVLPLEGTVLEWTAADVDGDGLRDLFIARRLPDGSRQIHVFRMRPDGALPSAPDHVVDVKSDVVSWGVGEFRPEEPGVELLLTTRAGAWTLSPRVRSYRGNIQSVVKAELLLDLASDRALPRWEAIADVDGDGVDEIALVTWSGILVVRANGEVLGNAAVPPSRGSRPAVQRAFKVGKATFNAQPMADFLVPDDDPGVLDPPPILYAKESMPLPELADTDGDGLLDLVYVLHNVLRVHRLKPLDAEADGRLGYAATPDLQVPIGREGGWELHALELVHAGGGPAVDVMLTRSEKGGPLTSLWQVMLYYDALEAPGRLAQPAGLVQTDASWAGGHLVNLDGDGRPDLAVSAWSLTLTALGIQGVDIEHVVQTHLARPQGGFEPRASFPNYERDYSADDFTAFSLVPPLGADLDGDGLTDLLEPGAHGELEMHAFQPAGSGKGFADKPSWTIPVEALTSTVEVTDLNGDGVGDFLVLHGLTSRKPVSTFEAYVSKVR